MTKTDLVRQTAKAIKKLIDQVIIDPGYQKETIEDTIVELIESYLDPVYCPTCGSCGETGCCSPDRCKQVICLYGETNLKDYKELLDENEMLRNNLKDLGYN